MEIIDENTIVNWTQCKGEALVARVGILVVGFFTVAQGCRERAEFRRHRFEESRQRNFAFILKAHFPDCIFPRLETTEFSKVSLLVKRKEKEKPNR